jgi:hypothetical protein
VNYYEDIDFGAMPSHFFSGKFLELRHGFVCRPIRSELEALGILAKGKCCAEIRYNAAVYYWRVI